MNDNNYWKLLLMLTVSFLIMYTVMFLNVDRSDHIYLSTTRLYMTILMVSPMALVMLLADEIIKAQEEEIAQMKEILNRMIN